MKSNTASVKSHPNHVGLQGSEPWRLLRDPLLCGTTRKLSAAPMILVSSPTFTSHKHCSDGQAMKFVFVGHMRVELSKIQLARGTEVFFIPCGFLADENSSLDSDVSIAMTPLLCW